MLAVVLVATALGLLASSAQVRGAYRQSLMDLFQSETRSVVAVRDAELQAVQAQCRRLVGLPRVFAAMSAFAAGEGQADDLYDRTSDDLKEFFRRAQEVAGGGRSSAGYLFLDRAGKPIEPSGNRADIDAGVGQRWQREPAAVREGGDERLAYLSVGDRALQAMYFAVPDPEDGSRLGTLAVFFPFTPPQPEPVEGGVRMRTGLLLEGRLFGDQLPATAAGDLARAADTTAGAVECPLELEGHPWLARLQPIEAGDASVRLVTAASLVPMHQAVRSLLLSGLAAGSVGVLIGVVVAVVTARGMARPVAALSEAATRVGRGDYAVRLPVARRDELGLLAERFNEMTVGLTLRDKYRGLLDLVADPGIAERMIGGSVNLGGVTTPAAVIFCDIRGFTPLTNSRTAHEVVELLNRHMTALTEVVYRHGGVVDKFVGDLIMAVFGAPRGAPDDAERAARCALDMVRERERLNRVEAVPIQIGVGVAYGDMVAGCMGSERRLNYTVLGERVNLAARLCSAAPAGAVYVDQAVRERLGRGWSVTALDPLKVKGFDQPVSAWRLDDWKENP
jgi:class 3 adenylate cyclase